MEKVSIEQRIKINRKVARQYMEAAYQIAEAFMFNNKSGNRKLSREKL